MSEYTYDIAEALLPWDERPERPCVTISHPEYGTVEVVTNRDLEGFFRKVEGPSGMSYVQTMGTQQFSLPDDANGIRRTLRALLRRGAGPAIDLV